MCIVSTRNKWLKSPSREVPLEVVVQTSNWPLSQTEFKFLCTQVVAHNFSYRYSCITTTIHTVWLCFWHIYLPHTHKEQLNSQGWQTQSATPRYLPHIYLDLEHNIKKGRTEFTLDCKMMDRWIEDIMWWREKYRDFMWVLCRLGLLNKQDTLTSRGL